jgi:hypothetical protein
MSTVINGDSNINLDFSTGGRITGDFSNSTLANRAIFQSSTANGASGVIAVPNGTGVVASWSAQNSSDVTNGASIAIRASDTDMSVRSGIVGTGTYLPMTFYTGGSERMRVDTSGNVLIGTSTTRTNYSGGAFTPAFQIEKAGDIRASITRDSDDTSGPVLYLGKTRGTTVNSNTVVASGDNLGLVSFDGSDGTNMVRGAAITAQVDGTPGSADMPGRLLFSTTADGAATATERMRIDSSGNVGIGLASTGDARLEVYSADAATIYKNSASGTGSSDGFYVGLGKGSATDAYVYNRESANLIFGTANTERARIDSNGNLLLGSTSLAFANQRAVQLQTQSTGLINIQHLNTEASGSAYMWFVFNGGAIGSITQNGTTAVAYNTTSDYRLKENVQPLTGALSRVAALKPCTYTWKSAPDEIGEGFIAHELAEVCPQAVTGEKDAVNEDGSIKPQGIDTSFLVATLTAAIQEQQAIITALTARVEALEGTQP